MIVHLTIRRHSGPYLTVLFDVWSSIVDERITSKAPQKMRNSHVNFRIYEEQLLVRETLVRAPSPLTLPRVTFEMTEK